MNKLFNAFLIGFLCLLLSGCTNNKSSDDDKIIEKLSTTEKIVIKDPIKGTGSIKAIVDIEKINEIITILSSATKLSDDFDINYIGAVYELEMFDEKEQIIDKIEVFKYTTSNQQEGYIRFDSSKQSYTLDIELLVRTIEN